MPRPSNLGAKTECILDQQPLDDKIFNKQWADRDSGRICIIGLTVDCWSFDPRDEQHPGLGLWCSECTFRERLDLREKQRLNDLMISG